MVPENSEQKLTLWQRAALAVDIGKRIIRGDESKGDPVFPRGDTTSWTDSWGRPISFLSSGINTNVDYRGETGELTTSSLVMAVVNFVGTMLAEAPPEVVRYDKTGKATVISDHRLTLLLKNPNPYYDFATLVKALALSLLIGGNNYWLMERDPKNFFQVIRIWWLPHFLVTPRWDRTLPSDFISSYRYQIDGRRIDYLPEDVVHIRGTPNPHNPRVGMGIFDPVIEEIFGDKMAARFSAVLFKNLGIVQYVISPPKPAAGETGGGSTGFGFGKDEAKARAKALQIQDSFIRATTGDNAGKPVVNTIPLEIQKLSFSPQELDMKELRKVPESRVAGVSGVPASVLQYLVGLENGTSYASYEQAREQGYEQVIIPLQRMIAAAINKYLMPEFADGDGRLEFRFDLSDVRVLQDDQDKLYTRLTQAVQAGWLQVADAREAAGFPYTVEDRIYLRSGQIAEVPATEEAARALDKRRQLIESLNPPPPPPPQLPPAPDNSDLTEDGETVIAGERLLQVLRKRLQRVLGNGHSPEDKDLARGIVGLLGDGGIQKKTVEYDGMVLWREPTDIEKSINLKAIQDAFDDGQKDLEDQLLDLRLKLIDDAIAGLISLSPADYHTLVLSASETATSALRDKLQDIYDRGRELVIEELTAQGASDLGEIGDPDEEDATMLDDLSDITVSRVINDVQARAIGAAAGLALTGIVASALESELQEELDEGSTSYISAAAAEVDHAALGLGRAAEAADREDIIQEVYYSAVLDSSCCDNCAAVDGETGATPDDIPPAPNPDCEGGARCRCVHVYVFDDSSKARRKWPPRHRGRSAKFNPDQPRDDQGRFAAGGGGGSASTETGSSGESRSFSSDVEGKQFITEHFSEWRDGLTAKQDQALAFYQSPGYELMNGQLRGHSVDAPDTDLARAKDAVKNLDAAIAKAPPLTETLTAHRGLSAQQFGKLAEGDVVTDLGFTSVSLTAGSGTKGNAEAVIELPVGMRVAAGRTKELILPRGTRFRVKSYKKAGKKVTYHFEVV